MAPVPATYAFEDDDEDDDTFALRPTENKVNSDMTNVDFEYADSDEVAGTAEIIASLTQEEQKAMPDEFMALRHYRAEKVRLTTTTTILAIPMYDHVYFLFNLFSCGSVLPCTIICTFLCTIFRATSPKQLRKLRQPFSGEKNLGPRRSLTALIRRRVTKKWQSLSAKRTKPGKCMFGDMIRAGVL